MILYVLLLVQRWLLLNNRQTAGRRCARIGPVGGAGIGCSGLGHLDRGYPAGGLLGLVVELLVVQLLLLMVVVVVLVDVSRWPLVVVVLKVVHRYGASERRQVVVVVLLGLDAR